MPANDYNSEKIRRRLMYERGSHSVQPKAMNRRVTRKAAVPNVFGKDNQLP